MPQGLILLRLASHVITGNQARPSSSPPGSKCLRNFGFLMCFLLTHSFPTDMSHNWNMSLATQQLHPLRPP